MERVIGTSRAIDSWVETEAPGPQLHTIVATGVSAIVFFIFALVNFGGLSSLHSAPKPQLSTRSAFDGIRPTSPPAHPLLVYYIAGSDEQVDFANQITNLAQSEQAENGDPDKLTRYVVRSARTDDEQRAIDWEIDDLLVYWVGQGGDLRLIDLRKQ
jgi:hypothetical protein